MEKKLEKLKGMAEQRLNRLEGFGNASDIVTVFDVRPYLQALEEHLTASTEENSRLRTDYQIMKASLLRCQNEILSRAPSGHLIPSQPSGMNFRDRLGKRFASARENVRLSRIINLHQPPSLGNSEAVEVNQDLPTVLESERVQDTEALGGLHVEESSSGHGSPENVVTQDHSRMNNAAAEREELLRALDEELFIVLGEIETLIRGEVERNDTELVRAIAVSKQTWMSEAATALRNRLHARLQPPKNRDFGQN